MHWKYSEEDYIKLVHVFFCNILVTMLFWDDITIICDENIVYFLTEKKKLLWTNKKFVYLIFINKLSLYHPKITYGNIVQNDMKKFIRNIQV